MRKEKSAGLPAAAVVAGKQLITIQQGQEQRYTTMYICRRTALLETACELCWCVCVCVRERQRRVCGVCKCGWVCCFAQLSEGRYVCVCVCVCHCVRVVCVFRRHRHTQTPHRAHTRTKRRGTELGTLHL